MSDLFKKLAELSNPYDATIGACLFRTIENKQLDDVINKMTKVNIHEMIGLITILFATLKLKDVDIDQYLLNSCNNVSEVLLKSYIMDIFKDKVN